jgi:hypothetical protein
MSSIFPSSIQPRLGLSFFLVVKKNLVAGDDQPSDLYVPLPYISSLPNILTSTANPSFLFNNYFSAHVHTNMWSPMHPPLSSRRIGEA